VADPRRALEALLEAIGARLGTDEARELARAAVPIAQRPIPEGPPEQWHRSDMAYGFGAHLLAGELLDAINERAAERATTNAVTKASKKGAST
jgi:hypothetical protein